MLFCCLVVLLFSCFVDCKKSPNRVSAIFHSSLFTFHFSLHLNIASHSSFFNLHFNRRCDVLQVSLALPVVEGGFLETVIVVPESEELVDILRFG